MFFLGESHFRAFEQPYLYAQILFLTGQFEAVSYLIILGAVHIEASWPS